MANTAINHDPVATFPGSSTNTAVVKWSGTSGNALLDSGVIIDASNNVTGLNNVTATGYLHLTGDEKELRFYEGANYIAIAAPSGLGADYTFTLPLNDGSADEFLQTNGSGVLVWAVPATHADSHTVVSHSDTTATGAELETLTDGSTTALHAHSGGGPSQATQSDIEARTNQDTYIAPDMLHFHAGVAKTWVYFPATGVTGTLTNNNSYNITELTDTNVGVRTIEIATAFSNSTYAPMGSGDLGPSRGVSVTIVDANTVLLQTYNTSSTLTDYAGAFSAHGDQ